MIESIEDLIIFLKHFHRRPLGSVSMEPELIPSDLPAGLALIYQELGSAINTTNLFDTQDRLWPVSKLRRIDNMIEFSQENQNNWTVRCVTNHPDPSVYSDAADNELRHAQGFVQVCGSLNHFLITLCLQEALMSCTNLVQLPQHSHPEQTISELQPLWLNGYCVFGEPTHNFYISPCKDILVMDFAGIWVGSQERLVHQIIHPRQDFHIIAGCR